MQYKNDYLNIFSYNIIWKNAQNAKNLKVMIVLEKIVQKMTDYILLVMTVIEKDYDLNQWWNYIDQE